MATPLTTIAERVLEEARRATDQHGNYASQHEAYGVLMEEVEEYWEEVKRKPAKRNPKHMQAELIQVAAVAMRAAMLL